MRVLSKSLIASAVLSMMLAGCGGSDEAAATGDVAERMSKVGTVTVDKAAADGAQAASDATAAVVDSVKEAAAPVAEAAEAAAATVQGVAEQAAAAAGVAAEKVGDTVATVVEQVADATAGAADGEAVYNRTCMACHMAGVANAPKTGDAAAWEPRVAKGMDALLASAKAGVPGTAMPAMGTCADCSDDELLAAIKFMAGQ